MRDGEGSNGCKLHRLLEQLIQVRIQLLIIKLLIGGGGVGVGLEVGRMRNGELQRALEAVKHTCNTDK